MSQINRLSRAAAVPISNITPVVETTVMETVTNYYLIKTVFLSNQRAESLEAVD